ncbi:aminopeptidase P family protein [Streptomyces sp. LMG1-1-1.1]
MSEEHFTEQELAEFKAAQRLAYDAVAAVEAQLYEGITEKQAAQAVEDWLRDHGVRRFFHYGFAWFGERTRCRDFARPSGGALGTFLNPRLSHFGNQFLPTDRPLRHDEAVILDVGPVVGDVACDMGYSCTLGDQDNEEFHEARMALEPYRDLIPQLVRQGAPQSEIYHRVDELITEQGTRTSTATTPAPSSPTESGASRALGCPPLPDQRLQPTGAHVPQRPPALLHPAAPPAPDTAVEQGGRPALRARAVGGRTTHRSGRLRCQVGRDSRRHRGRRLLARRRPPPHPLLERARHALTPMTTPPAGHTVRVQGSPDHPVLEEVAGQERSTPKPARPPPMTTRWGSYRVTAVARASARASAASVQMEAAVGSPASARCRISRVVTPRQPVARA